MASGTISLPRNLMVCPVLWIDDEQAYKLLSPHFRMLPNIKRQPVLVRKIFSIAFPFANSSISLSR